MKLLNSIVSALFLSAYTVAGDNLRGNDDIAGDIVAASGHRELQGGIVGTACAVIGGFLPGRPACQCALSPTFDVGFACIGSNPVCAGGPTGFCSIPSATGVISILSPGVSFEFCLNSATNGGVSVPGLCINVGGNVDDTIADGDGDETEVVEADADAGGYSCSASIEGKSCASCTMCGLGKGYKFDCSDIDAAMIQSECTPLVFPTTFRKRQEEASFLPNLD